MIFDYVKFGITILAPGLLAGLLYLLNTHTGLKNLPYMAKQIIIGILFGALACLGTEWSIPVQNAQINCRDAAPLCAGLMFGAPAGIIAGVIGGVERWFAVYWGISMYSRLACSLATVVAGLYAALLRKYIFEDENLGAIMAFAIGVVMEVIHMTILFITNMSEPLTAMAVVKVCIAPMAITNGIALAICDIMVYLSKPHTFKIHQDRIRISQTVLLWLLVTVVFAFLVTSYFVVSMQTKLSEVQTDRTLQRSNDEIVSDIQDASDANMVAMARLAANDVKGNNLKITAMKYGFDEINIIDSNGIIISTTEEEFMGFDMNSGAQSSAFLNAMKGQDSYVQPYMNISYDANVHRKYAGIRSGEYIIQFGYTENSFYNDIASQIVGITKNRHVGDTGFIIITDSELNIISSPDTINIKDTSFLAEVLKGEENVTSTCMIDDIEYYTRHISCESYDIISFQPAEEATQLRTIAIYVNTFMEIMVFALMFGMIYQLIKQVVVNQVHSINSSLNKISSGDLDEFVSVRTSEEFASLSDDINRTVLTLKGYISDAEERINKELEVARSIQASALPSVRPNFSDREDVQLGAFMQTAKEVGGDFYDFYMTGSHTLNFVIADVSGKGIPAAMFMMSSKTELKNNTESGMAINDAFTRSNADLCASNEAGMFVTAWQGSLDLQTGTLKYVNAGHNPPLIRRKDGSFEMLKSRPNFILGGMDGVKYRLNEMKLERGDILFLYTDGVTEATNTHNELYGDQRLIDCANSAGFETPDELCACIKADVDRFVGEAPQFDDITMLAVKYTGVEPDWCMRFEKAVLEDIPTLTQLAEEEFERIGCSMKITMQLNVAIDEIYSNIVKFAYPGSSGFVELSIHESKAPHTVSLTFTDSGVPYNPLTNAEPDTTLSAEERGIGGLGIYIVKKTMDEVAYRYENDKNIFTITKKLD